MQGRPNELSRSPLRRHPALAVSLAANVLLSALLGGIALRRLVLRAAPAPEERLAIERRSVLASLPARSGTIVLFGDSLTERGEWAELLDDPRVVNRGVAGDTVPRARDRLESVTSARPRAVFIMLGINDLADGSSPASVASDYDALVGAIRSSAPDSTVYVQSVLPIRKSGAPTAVANEAIVELNRALRGVAERRGAHYVDVASRLGDAGGELDARYTLDGVHLTGPGYLAWKEVLAPLTRPATGEVR